MVIWSDTAKQDLKQIYNYIARDSKFYALKVVEEIVEGSEKLGLFPKMGRIVPETDTQNIRELIIYSYRLIYKVSADMVEILTIVHVKRDFL